MHLCSICCKEFKQKAALLQHGCVHTQSRPFVCRECGKAFRQQSHLIQHRRIHTNEKPYGCVYCGRSFRQRTILNQHVRIHTGEKPYKCEQCGKDFRQKAILDQHIRTHQSHQLIACSIPNCRRKFFTELEIQKHLEKHASKVKKEVFDEKCEVTSISPYPSLPPPPPSNLTPLIKPEFYLPSYYPHFSMTPNHILPFKDDVPTEYRLTTQ